ncbi:MAG: hypothetical protein LBS36_08030 [Oscillospiraceae bacterium]|jgi:hypothetical protein|nr:hypothetical protein [Oscillospiraceae bacterium]
MITIFNRREIANTHDMRRQAELRDLLTQNGIRYALKVVNRRSASPFSAGSRSRTGTTEEKLSVEYDYVFYVHKADEEKVLYLIINKQSES